MLFLINLKDKKIYVKQACQDESVGFFLFPIFIYHALL